TGGTSFLPPSSSFISCAEAAVSAKSADAAATRAKRCRIGKAFMALLLCAVDAGSRTGPGGAGAGNCAPSGRKPHASAGSAVRAFGGFTPPPDLPCRLPPRVAAGQPRLARQPAGGRRDDRLPRRRRRDAR